MDLAKWDTGNLSGNYSILAAAQHKRRLRGRDATAAFCGGSYKFLHIWTKSKAISHVLRR